MDVSAFFGLFQRQQPRPIAVNSDDKTCELPCGSVFFMWVPQPTHKNMNFCDGVTNTYRKTLYFCRFHVNPQNNQRWQVGHLGHRIEVRKPSLPKPNSQSLPQILQPPPPLYSPDPLGEPREPSAVRMPSTNGKMPPSLRHREDSAFTTNLRSATSVRHPLHQRRQPHEAQGIQIRMPPSCWPWIQPYQV